MFDEDGTLVGDYLADLLVAGEVVVELKAAKALAPEHEAQILGYLKSARLRHGLPINFGSYTFEIRQFVWDEGSIPQRTGTLKKAILGLLAPLLALLAVY